MWAPNWFPRAIEEHTQSQNQLSFCNFISLHAYLASERYDNASFSMDKSSERLAHLKPSFACRGPVDCAIEDGSVGDGGPGDRS